MFIRRVSDGRIVKSMITEDNKEEIEVIFKQCCDGDVYDVIIVAQWQDLPYENLGKMKLRYLNYSLNEPTQLELRLHHPEHLTSAILYNLRIVNLASCLNLANIYSVNNAYAAAEISSLAKIKRLYSHYDAYESFHSFFVSDLFKNNQIEYLHI